MREFQKAKILSKFPAFSGSASTLLSSSSRESNLSCCAASAGPVSSTVSTVHPPLQHIDSTRPRHSTRRSIERTYHLPEIGTSTKNASKIEPLSEEPNGHIISPPPIPRNRSASRQSTTLDSNRKASGDSSGSQKIANEMTNRLRRPLSAIGSFMSGGSLTAHPENSSHEVFLKYVVFNKNY